MDNSSMDTLHSAFTNSTVVGCGGEVMVVVGL